MRTLIEPIVTQLNNQHELVVATIVEKSGSAPREAGTKMLIYQDGTIEGTIGGGLLEAMIMRLAPEVLNAKQCRFQDFELSNTDAAAEGMVCGGEVRVFLEYVEALDIHQLNVYHKAKELKSAGVDFMVITKISPKSTRTLGKNKWICTETQLHGVEDSEVEALAQELRKNFNRTKFHLLSAKNEYMIEPCYATQKLYIVGAGHVSQQIAMLSKSVGFYTVVIDDRAEFANQERFPYTNEVHVISSYGTLRQEVEIAKNGYIVIVSRSHALDQIILQQALDTNAKYIGMIGSKTKKAHIYGELLAEGFAKEALEEVHCPIGVPIGAQTPEEIAISIVAELIKAKRA